VLSTWGGCLQVAKMDHLVCFLPGAVALGAHYGAGTGLSRGEEGPDDKARKGYRPALSRELLMQVCANAEAPRVALWSPSHLRFVV